MKNNQFWAVVRKAFVAVAVTLVVTLMLTSGVWAASKYKTLHTFKGSKGGHYPTGLIFDQAGNLYGTTYQGGAYKQGTVFQLAPNLDGSWTKNVIYSFNNAGNDGRWPIAGLIFDQAGNLYGTTYLGGAYKQGTVFQLTPNGDGSWRESVLHSFNNTDGSNPSASLVFDAAGNLYGTTRTGGTYYEGTVFQLTPNSDGSWTESVLYSFTNGADGGNPYAELIFDAAGNLYGTTFQGGDLSACSELGCGVVFELTRNADGAWTESVLHSFTDGADGGLLFGGLTFDPAGNLYGTTYSGGTYGYGVVFQLTPNPGGSWREKVLHRFTDGKDGGLPYSNLIVDAAGNLCGTTTSGGAYGGGVVFKLVPNAKAGWHETVLHAFTNHQSISPAAGVIFDTAGNLYGTTWGAANTTFGSVFEITP